MYYTIDKLHTAIANRKAVTFKYFEYNVKKEKVFRREGKRYTVSPLGLIWDNENYYLAGYDHRSCEMRHYRVDKMAELAVTCLPLEGADGGFDIASYAQKHFGMFSGREGQVTLRCRNSLVGVVLDRFGRDAILVPDGEEHFTVTVPAVVSPQFLGWVFGLGDGVQTSPPRLGGGGAEAPAGRGGGPLPIRGRAGTVCAPAHLRLSTVSPAEVFGGRDSVKGNRQGSLEVNWPQAKRGRPGPFAWDQSTF